jgi:hypothetical protein
LFTEWKEYKKKKEFLVRRGGGFENKGGQMGLKTALPAPSVLTKEFLFEVQNTHTHTHTHSPQNKR